VYKFKDLGMQTVSTNICERMGCSQELSEFQCGTLRGCHLCNKSSCEISSLLNIPQSAVSGIITKWTWLGTTATQPQRGRHRKMTERGQRMLIAHSAHMIVNFLQSQSLQTSKLHVAFKLAQEQCVESFMEWVSMAEQLHLSEVQCRASNAVV